MQPIIGIVGAGPAGLVAAIALARRGLSTTVFERDMHPADAVWKPEADAVSWISERHLFDNRLHGLRSRLTMALDINVVGHSQSSRVSYSEVQREAKRYWPLWV